MNDQNVTNQYQPTMPRPNAGVPNIFSNGLFVLGLAGLIGGMAGAILSEVVQGGDVNRFFSDYIRISTGIWFSLAMLGIGAAMSVSQGITERNPEKSATAALLAIPASLVGGFLAGVIGQSVYGPLSESGLPNEIPRAIGWAIAGGLGGAAVGAGFRSLVRIRNCALGGLVGGFVGGLVFNTVGRILQFGFGSRFVGITLIGALMGLAVGLIDMVTVTSFVEQSTREGAPIRFSLFNQSTLLGCASNVGIKVRGDVGVSEHHLQLTKQGKSLAFQCVGNAAPITVNGQQLTNGVLNNGDVFVVGNTQFRYVAGKSSGFPQFGQGQQQGPGAQNQPWQQAPQQQPDSRQSVPMQPVTPRQPGTTQQQTVQQNPAPSSRPIIQIKKPD
jgi:hypothetical protein